MREVVDKVVEELKKNINSFEDEKELKEDFYEIKKVKTDKKLIFVDGGNAEILAMPSISLQLIRIFYSVYDKNKRTKAEKTEFYLLVNSVNENDRIIYKTGIFPIKGEIELKLSFDSLDKKIITGSKRASISKIGEIVRRFAELKIAADALEKNNNAVVVLDGSLECTYPGETEIAEELYKAAGKNKSVVAALSKTTRLFTKKGSSVANVLNELGPDKAWYCRHINEMDKIDNSINVFFVKLNKNSNYVFRLDVEKDSGLDEIFVLLEENSKDLSFPGYPYGLIEADRIARISNNEKQMLKTMFLSKIGTTKLEKFLSSLDAHDLLDRLVNTK